MNSMLWYFYDRKPTKNKHTIKYLFSTVLAANTLMKIWVREWKKLKWEHHLYSTWQGRKRKNWEVEAKRTLSEDPVDCCLHLLLPRLANLAEEDGHNPQLMEHTVSILPLLNLCNILINQKKHIKISIMQKPFLQQKQVRRRRLYLAPLRERHNLSSYPQSSSSPNLHWLRIIPHPCTKLKKNGTSWWTHRYLKEKR